MAAKKGDSLGESPWKKIKPKSPVSDKTKTNNMKPRTDSNKRGK